MAFSFGLGTNNMQNQYNQDTSVFKVHDIAKNIQKYDSAPAPPPGQAPLSAAAYVDYTARHLNRFMQRDQENDNSATFLFEYQALLRARMQQMITELTAALTRDIDAALIQQRADWNTAPGGRGRDASQGYSSDVEDAGAARVAYNFLTGFADAANPAGASTATPNGSVRSVPYTGIPTWDQQLGAYVNKVSPDTSADALFHSTRGAVLRSVGTATIQQAFPEDGLNVAVMDELVVRHGAQNVLYQETGGGFIASQNRYKFTDIDPITGSTPTAAATNINRYNTQNIGFLNDSMVNTGAVNAGHLDGNLNDNTWDTATAAAPPTIAYQLFNQTGNVKNEFQRVLYDTIFELDQRNLLRDVFRLSEKNGFLTDIQIASTSSLVTGSQAQASIFLNFRPFYDGVTAGRAYRPDLGGNVDVIMDRFTAFYHSG